jgi:hypothetical protein
MVTPGTGTVNADATTMATIPHAVSVKESVERPGVTKTVTSPLLNAFPSKQPLNYQRKSRMITLNSPLNSLNTNTLRS